MCDEGCCREMKQFNKFTSSVDSVWELIFLTFTELSTTIKCGNILRNNGVNSSSSIQGTRHSFAGHLYHVCMYISMTTVIPTLCLHSGADQCQRVACQLSASAGDGAAADQHHDPRVS